MNYGTDECDVPQPRGPVDPLTKLAGAADRMTRVLERSLDTSAKKAVEAPVRRKGPYRHIETEASNFGEVGQVVRGEFVNRDGSTLYANRTSNEDGLSAFSIALNGARSNSPMGLRELACELAVLADQLDGNTTLLTLSTPGLGNSKKKGSRRAKAK